MSTELAVAEARIRGLIAAYCHALDDGRTEDLVAMFVPDGTATLPRTPPLRGHDALRAGYAAMVPAVPQRHVVTNIHVREYDAGRATVVSDMVLLVKGERAWTVRLVGRYTDVLRQEGDEWLFESRELVLS